MCIGAVELFLGDNNQRNILCPSDQFAEGGGDPLLSCAFLRIVYMDGSTASGTCDGNVKYCPPDQSYLPDTKYMFQISPSHCFKMVMVDTLGMEHDAFFDEAHTRWELDPSPTYLGFPAVNRARWSTSGTDICVLVQ